MSERYGYGTYEDPDSQIESERPDGFRDDGEVSRDYLEAGRDPHLPRQTQKEIDAAVLTLLNEEVRSV